MKVAVITGAIGGIGMVTSKKLSEEGYAVCGIDISALKENEFNRSVSDNGKLYVCDITDEISVNQTIDAIVSDYGHIDYLVNMAGAGAEYVRLADTKTSDFTRVMDINLKGTYFMLKAVLPIMVNQKKGSIVNVASIAGTKAIPGISLYGAAKKAVISLSESVTGEYYQYGIRCNAVSPGSVHAGLKMSEKSTSVYIGDEAERIKRRAKPEEVADVICYLLSDKASHLSGLNIVIDNGRNYLREDIVL